MAPLLPSQALNVKVRVTHVRKGTGWAWVSGVTTQFCFTSVGEISLCQLTIIQLNSEGWVRGDRRKRLCPLWLPKRSVLDMATCVS